MAYKTFANGFPLPASDLNNYLMNQSVIVFENSGARSTQIPTPIEGMVTYLEDTNAVEVWDGTAWLNINDNTNSIPKNILSAAGSLIYAADVDTPAELTIAANGSLLTSNGSEPAWLANSGVEGQVLQVSASGGLEFSTPASGGIELITSTTPSASTVVFSSIPQTFKKLWFVMENIKVSGATARYQIKVRNGGSYLTMGTMLARVDSATETVQRESDIRTGQNVDSDALVSASFIFDNYSSTVGGCTYQGLFRGTRSGNFQIEFSAGGVYGTSAVDTIELSNNATSFASQGTVYLYGVN